MLSILCSKMGIRKIMMKGANRFLKLSGFFRKFNETSHSGIMNRRITNYIFWLALTLCSFGLSAQNKTVDSLQLVLTKQKEDSNKINTLNRLAGELKNKAPGQSISYAQQALELAAKLSFTKSPGLSNIIIGNANFRLGNYDEALKKFTIALALSEKIKDKKNSAKAYAGFGAVYANQGRYSEALQKLTEALKIRREIGDKLEIATTYNRIGSVYHNLGNIPEALKNFYTALEIMEEIQDKLGIAGVYNNIGNIYSDEGNPAAALKNHFAALKIREEIQDKLAIANSLNNIGTAYLDLKNYTEAKKNLFASLKIREEIQDKKGIATCNGNIGDLNEYQGNYAEALKHHYISLKIKEKMGNKQGMVYSYNSIATIYIHLKNYKEAKIYLEKSLRLSLETGSIPLLEDSYAGLSDLYKSLGKYEQAYEYYKKHIAYKDSLINENNTKKTVQMQMQYEFDKKSATDSIKNLQDKKLKNAEIAAKTADLKRGKAQFWFVLSSLFIVSIALIILFNRFRLIQQQKTTIEFQNKQIVESINYSKKIQDALLPDKTEMEKSLNSLFIYYDAKDIVSGDFYWYKQIEQYTVLACVDCTGHGVPGAFMSTLGSLLLDKIVSNKLLHPAEILKRLNEEVIGILHQQEGGEMQDGMDISVCLIDKENKNIRFSGARNGIIIVKEGQAQRYKADLLPVGGNYVKKGKQTDRSFTAQTIPVEANDWVYMYTDGFIEQIGGATPGTPMNYKQFEQHLIDVSGETGDENKSRLLQKKCDAWRNNHTRTDDILLMGFKVGSV